MNLLAKVCRGRFHDIMPKEYPGTFPELLCGLYKKMHTNASDIVTHHTNIYIFRQKDFSLQHLNCLAVSLATTNTPIYYVICHVSRTL
jgi:hypothetical protein